uniref:Carboxymuconolactone decarboxylase family protein n=1 Tax=Fervidobacterium pennivorans TaxID=93466 RepID=A0A7V4CMF9_FERPE
MDARKSVNDFMNTMKELAKTDKAYVDAFMNFFKEAEKPGALSAKEKALIAVAVAVSERCSYCIAIHTKNALDAGATREEILEAVEVSGLMGGGPAIAYITLVLEALDAFGAKQDK